MYITKSVINPSVSAEKEIFPFFPTHTHGERYIRQQMIRRNFPFAFRERKNRENEVRSVKAGRVSSPMYFIRLHLANEHVKDAFIGDYHNAMREKVAEDILSHLMLDVRRLENEDRHR